MTKTIYLDQNHLSNLSKPGNEPLRQRLLTFLKKDQVQVAVSYPHLLETAAIGTRPVMGTVVRDESPLIDAIADFLDEAPVIRMWSAFEIIRVEFREAAQAHLSGNPGTPISPFGSWDFIGTRVRAMTFRAEVSRVRLTPSILTQYWRTSEANAQWKDSVKAKEFPPSEAKFRDLLDAEARATINLFLQDRNYSDHWPPRMSEADRQVFAKNLNVSQCPALALYVAITALDRASKTTDGKPRRSRANDLVDLQAVAAAMAYCDVFLTERSLADQIKQVRKHRTFLGPPQGPSLSRPRPISRDR
jgi:hypothetical protein